MTRHRPYKALIIMSCIILLLVFFSHLRPIIDTSNNPKENETFIKPLNETPNDGKNSQKPNVNPDFVGNLTSFINEYDGTLEWIKCIILLFLGGVLIEFKHKVGIFFYNTFLYHKKIRNCKKRLKGDKYYNSIKLPFPECPIKELKMETAYINLSLKSDGKHSQEKYSSTQQIVENVEYKYLMIIGSPGSGKSTLCRNIVYQFGMNTMTDKIPILIELGNKEDINWGNIEESIFKIIKEQLNIHKLDLLIEQKLLKGDFRIMFDAFDEVGTDYIRTVNIGISRFIKKYKECAYIITCRKSVSDNFKKGECEEDIRTYEIKDLRIQDIENYVKEWEKQDTSLDVNTFLYRLEERSKIRELAKEPLMVALSIYLFKVSGSLPYSRTTFYDELSKHLVNKNMDDEYNLNIHSLSRIAWQIQQTYDSADNRGSHRITFETARGIIGERCEETLEILKKSGLLRKSNLEGHTCFEFPLKTHREYYVAYYMKYLHKDSNEERQKLLIDKYKKHPTNYREIVKFYCGMCKKDDNVSKLLEEIHNYDLEHKSTVALEALSESPYADDIANIILDYYFSIDANAWQDGIMDISKKLGAIVSNISEKGEYRLIGEKVFTKLNEFLIKIYPNRIEKSIDYQNVVSVLAASFTIHTSGVLLQYYQEDDNIINNALISMGNISVGHLGKFAEDGDNKAVDCLIKIGTDKALKELLRIIFLEKENESITRIAWYLAQTEYIKKMNSINNILEKVNSGGEKNTINYAWSPFETQEKSLTRIMNRISYLLLNTPVNSDKPTNAIIDNRLLIPLQIESMKINSRQNEKAETEYTKYIKSDHLINSIKKIDDLLHDPLYEKTMKYDDWSNEWQYLKERDTTREFTFSRKDLYHFIIPILALGVHNFINWLRAENIGLVLFSLFFTIAFIIIILRIDKEIYLNEKLMNYLGLKSKLELLYLLLIIISYVFASILFFPSEYSVNLFLLDYFLCISITSLIIARYEKWNSNSIFSKLLEELNIKSVTPDARRD